MMPVPERVRQRYARAAGLAFLIYMVVALVESSLFDSAIGSGDAADKLANSVANAPMLRAAAVLSLLTIVSALVLGVSLFVLTRDYDFHLALAGFAGRLAEGVIGVAYALPTFGIISAGHAIRDTAIDAEVVVAVLTSVRYYAAIFSASCFAAGSAAFAFLLLRGCAIPAVLARLGLLASLILLVALPTQLATDSRGLATMWVWLPMLAFELTLAVWLLAKGVAPVGVVPAARAAAT